MPICAQHPHWQPASRRPCPAPEHGTADVDNVHVKPPTSPTRPVFLVDAPPAGQARFRSLPDDEVAASIQEAGIRGLQYGADDLKLGNVAYTWFARETDDDRRELKTGRVAYETFDEDPNCGGRAWPDGRVELRAQADAWDVFRLALHEARHLWQMRRGLKAHGPSAEEDAEAYAARIVDKFKADGWA